MMRETREIGNARRVVAGAFHAVARCARRRVDRGALREIRRARRERAHAETFPHVRGDRVGLDRYGFGGRAREQTRVEACSSGSLAAAAGVDPWMARATTRDAMTSRNRNAGLR